MSCTSYVKSLYYSGWSIGGLYCAQSSGRFPRVMCVNGSRYWWIWSDRFMDRPSSRNHSPLGPFCQSLIFALLFDVAFIFRNAKFRGLTERPCNFRLNIWFVFVCLSQDMMHIPYVFPTGWQKGSILSVDAEVFVLFDGVVKNDDEWYDVI